jgi:glycopeptide antibiotics resistance protein
MEATPGSPSAEALPPVAAVPRLPRGAGLLLLAAYLAAVVFVELRPVPVAWVYDANLQPLASIRRELSAGTAQDYRHLAMTVLMTSPLGVLLPLAGGRVQARWLPSLLRTVAAAALLTTALELLQAAVPGHFLDVDDVLLNLLGVVLAHLAVVPLARSVLRQRRTRQAGLGAAPLMDRPPKQRSAQEP